MRVVAQDERERVKASGARVMSMDQIEGLEPMHEDWPDVDLGEPHATRCHSLLSACVVHRNLYHPILP